MIEKPKTIWFGRKSIYVALQLFYIPNQTNKSNKFEIRNILYNQKKCTTTFYKQKTFSYI